MRFSLAVLLACALLGGCSRSTVQTRFQAPEFSLRDIRHAHSLLVVAPNVRVTAFQKSYAALFKTPDLAAARVSGKILDSLNLDSVTSANTLPDSALANALSTPRPKYVLYVRSITVGDSLVEVPKALLPGMNGMEPAGGGTSKDCLVLFEVEVLDSQLAPIYAFAVRTKADVALYAYKTAILKALDAAARKTAAHLSGH